MRSEAPCKHLLSPPLKKPRMHKGYCAGNDETQTIKLKTKWGRETVFLSGLARRNRDLGMARVRYTF